MVKCGHGLLGHVTLKSAISEECTFDLNRSSVLLYIFRKAKSYCTSHWVGVASKGIAFLFMGLLKLPYLKNELMNSADFLHVRTNKIIFG